MDELQRTFGSDKPEGISELLAEAQEYLQKVEGRVPVDTMNGMKRLYASTLHRVNNKAEKK